MLARVKAIQHLNFRYIESLRILCLYFDVIDYTTEFYATESHYVLCIKIHWVLII